MKRLPWDGVRWSDTRQGIVAETVEAGSSAARAQIMPGDRLLAISLNNVDYEPQGRAEKVQIYLDQAQVDGKIHYLIERPSYPEESRFYYADLDHLNATHKWTPRVLYINLIGLVYLFVGFFVLFKQGGRAPFAVHFAGLCLAAFVFHSYAEIGTYRDLDLAIAFLRNAAFILFPPLFLHFCIVYPQRQQLFEGKRWRAARLLRAGNAVVDAGKFSFPAGCADATPAPTAKHPQDFRQVLWLFLPAVLLPFLAALCASVFFLLRTWVRASSAVVRQQMKWVIWGSLLAVAPFTLALRHWLLLDAKTDPG